MTHALRIRQLVVRAPGSPAARQPVLLGPIDLDVEEGEYLIRRGDPGESMYIIKTGDFRVPVFDDTGRVRMIARLGPRDIVGEMALLTGERRRADVIADTPAEVVVIDRGTMAPLLSENPHFARFLTEILGRRLDEAGGVELVGGRRRVLVDPAADLEAARIVVRRQVELHGRSPSQLEGRRSSRSAGPRAWEYPVVSLPSGRREIRRYQSLPVTARALVPVQAVVSLLPYWVRPSDRRWMKKSGSVTRPAAEVSPAGFGQAFRW